MGLPPLPPPPRAPAIPACEYCGGRQWGQRQCKGCGARRMHAETALELEHYGLTLARHVALATRPLRRSDAREEDIIPPAPSAGIQPLPPATTGR